MKGKLNDVFVKKCSGILKKAQIVTVGFALVSMGWSWPEWNSTLSSLLQDTVLLLLGMTTTVTLVLLHVTFSIKTVTMCLMEFVCNTILSFCLLYVGIIPFFEWTPDLPLISSETVFGTFCLLASFAYLSDAVVAIQELCLMEERYKKAKRGKSRNRKIKLVAEEEFKKWWALQLAMQGKQCVLGRRVNGKKQVHMSGIQEEEDEVDRMDTKTSGTGTKDENGDKKN